MAGNEALVRRLYEAFNRRDIPAALALVTEAVAWANGIDGGHVHGREAVRVYWTQQWAAIQPQVTPLEIDDGADDAVRVEVRQVVRDLGGRILLDEHVQHAFTFDGALVARFDISRAGDLASIAHR